MNPEEGYRGFAKFPRYFTAYDIFREDHNTVIVYLYLLANANHKPGKWKGMPYETGQFYSSYNSISKGTGLSIKQVRNSIDKLKSIKLPSGNNLAIFKSFDEVIVDTKKDTINGRIKGIEKDTINGRVISVSKMPKSLLITVNNYDYENLTDKKGQDKRHDIRQDEWQEERHDKGQQYLNSLDIKNRASEKTLARENEEDNFEDACNIDDGFGACASEGAAPSQTTKQNGNSGNGSSGNRQNGNYNKSSNKSDYYVPKSTDEIPWYVHFNVYHITGEKACTTDVWNKPVIMDKFRDNPKGACEFYARLKDGAEHPERYKDVAVSMKVDKHDDE